jgi:phosphotransferase system enzyme I (PtsI)
MSGRPRVFRGIGASPGVAIGRVFLLDRGQVRVPRYHIGPEQVGSEQARLEKAVAASVDQLEAIRNRFVGGGMDHQAILEAHEMMLRDKALVEEAAALIGNEHLNAEWAISRVISRIRALFDQVADPYFRERRGDIDFVGERILRNLVGQHADIAELGDIGDDTVVVARDLSPVDTALLTRHKVTAFVTEVGGKTSHTSIIARSLEVPAVVGAHGIFDAAGSGDIIVVDGLDGTVMLRPSRTQLDRGRKRSEQFHRVNLDLLEAKALPARTLDGRDLIIAGNIELPTEVTTVLARGGEAIGLYRTEFMFLGRNTFPDEDDHFRTYCRIFDDVGQRPVTVRTLDLGGDKLIGPVRFDSEPNPALGLRAIRFCLQNRSLFEAQIGGLLRAGTRGDLRIMLPMVSGIEELRLAKEIIHDVAVRLTREGKEFRRDVPVGIMVEVPSAALTADALARECAFFAIGTNDLLQYLLAIDRTNERVAYLYRPLHPAVLRTLQGIVAAAREADVPVSVCGEMAGDGEYTPILLGLGFGQLSMNAGSIPKVKRLVREVRQEDCDTLLQEALQCQTPREVETLVRDFMNSKVTFATNVFGGPSSSSAD